MLFIAFYFIFSFLCYEDLSILDLTNTAFMSSPLSPPPPPQLPPFVLHLARVSVITSAAAVASYMDYYCLFKQIDDLLLHTQMLIYTIVLTFSLCPATTALLPL